MRRQVVALALALGLTTGCGIGTEEAPRALATDSDAYRLVAPDQRPAGVGTFRAGVYLVQNRRLVRVERQFPSTPEPQSVVETLALGPTEVEQGSGLTTALVLGAGTRVLSVRGSTAVVAVAQPSAEGRDEVLGYAQLVLTLVDLPGIDDVLFQRDGQPLHVPRADGSLSNGALTGEDYRALLPS